MSLLGIDVGTSGCKSAVLSEEGRLLGFAYEEYDYQNRRPGHAVLDSEQVWAKVRSTIGRASCSAGQDPIRAVCVSSLGEAVIPVTHDRRILGPAILNFDVRGSEYLEGLRGRISDERLYDINGNTLGNQYTLTKLKWLKEHQPEVYDRADVFLHWSGFISFMLGAEPYVDYSLANRTLLFDVGTADWSTVLFDLAGLDLEKLPRTVPAGTLIGSVPGSIAAQLGLPAGIPIVSGAHDQCCNGIGAGVLRPGQAMYGMGTFLCLMPVFGRRPSATPMVRRGLNTEHHAAPGRYVSFVYNQGGALVKWFRNTFALAGMQDEASGGTGLYASLLGEMPEGPSSVMALPHFTTTGPPSFIDDSSGLLAGLRLETSRGDILKGLLEGMTFYLRESLEGLPRVGIEVEELRAVGGGSQSDAWIQITADILGRPFIRPRVREAGTLGAAILAGAGCGTFDSLETGVEAMVRTAEVFEPDPSRKSLYDDRFEKYRRLWPLVGDYLRGLNR